MTKTCWVYVAAIYAKTNRWRQHTTKLNVTTLLHLTSNRVTRLVTLSSIFNSQLFKYISADLSVLLLLDRDWPGVGLPQASL